MESAVALLNRAAALVGGDRAAQHGDKYENHQNIAALWNAYLDNRVAGELRASEIALMMALLKIARTQTGAFNADDFLDLAGYAAVAFECAVRERAEAVEDPTTSKAALVTWPEARADWEHFAAKPDTCRS
jgi:hypothetical protein